MEITHNSLADLTNRVKGQSATAILKTVAEAFGEEAVFSTSFGLEDQVITHLIAQDKLPIELFTLDTGRLFPETYKTLNTTRNRYKLKIKTYYPNTQKVQDLVSEKGPFSFYDSIENRKECCFIRKVEPLKRALKGKKCWVTGIRATQSTTRTDKQQVEYDEANDIIKVHPLLHWTHDEVERFIEEHHIPYNPLHDQGFPSIGCQPCTRAVKEGEDIRAGRWWWENPDKKECGLHR